MIKELEKKLKRKLTQEEKEKIMQEHHHTTEEIAEECGYVLVEN